MQRDVARKWRQRKKRFMASVDAIVIERYVKKQKD